jgi:hypothetical protein
MNTTLTAPAALEQDWDLVLQRIPVNNLVMRALHTQAFVRVRHVRQVTDLLRLVLAYAVCGWSLQMVCLWAAALGIAILSPVALRKRLQGCHMLLGRLVGDWLLERQTTRPGQARYVRIVDASFANRPGTTGTDLRVHLDFDLAAAALDGIAITDYRQGETLRRHPTQPGCISIADCAYAQRRGLGSITADGGLYVVRLNWQNLPLLNPQGEPLDLLRFLRSVPDALSAATPALVDTPHGRFLVRVVARRLSAEQTERNRRRVRRQTRQRGTQPDARTLEAAGFVFLITNLPADGYSADDVLQLYRFRWQIELKIKRLKSIWHLAQLGMHCPILSQVVLLGRFLAVLLAEDLSRDLAQAFTGRFGLSARPVSIWRLEVMWREVLLTAIRGHLSLACLLALSPHLLARYLRDSPRRDRQRQDVVARSVLDRLLS